MKDAIEFTEVSLEKRINLRQINKDTLRDRSIKYFHILTGTEPLRSGDNYGCPVCYSKLSEHDRLVREEGYIVCDYCVSYVEGYI